ncbi:MAG: DUF748 domain-containing protein [Planctomycetota bacterium]|jgi:hypothetical protein
MKKKLKKILSIVLAAIVILLIVIVLAVTLFANTIIKKGVQIGGSRGLGVPVNVDSVNLSIIRGKLQLHNFVVGNPPGYEHEKFLQLKNGVFDLDIGSLMTDTVNIEEITFDGLNVVLEQKTLTKNNIKDILNALPKSEPSDEPEQQEKGAPKNLKIAKLQLKDISVQAKLLPVSGKSDTVTFKMSPIVMTDLGTDQKMDFADLSGKIILALAKGIAGEGAGVLPEGMVDSVKDSYNKAIELGKSYGTEGMKLLDTGKEEGAGLLEGVKGLFQKDEE